MEKRDSLKKESKESLTEKGKTLIGHCECHRIFQNKKVSLSKKSEKTYKVTVTYVQLSAEEVRTKRAIIETILKKGK